MCNTPHPRRRNFSNSSSFLDWLSKQKNDTPARSFLYHRCNHRVQNNHLIRHLKLCTPYLSWTSCGRPIVAQNISFEPWAPGPFYSHLRTEIKLASFVLVMQGFKMPLRICTLHLHRKIVFLWYVHKRAKGNKSETDEDFVPIAGCPTFYYLIIATTRTYRSLRSPHSRPRSLLTANSLSASLLSGLPNILQIVTLRR